MKSIFIYQPTTGNRVFASKDVNTVVWPNGSQHAIASFHFAVDTVKKSSHWREAAKTALWAVVNAVGGIAWDENGEIHFAGELFAAKDAIAALRIVAPQDLREEIAVIGWLQGLGLDERVDTSWLFSRATETHSPITMQMHASVDEDTQKWVVCVETEADGMVIVSAPLAWGEPMLKNFPPIEKEEEADQESVA